MSKSATVRVRDALRVVQLCKELGELPAVASVRRQHAAHALCRLLGSQVGVINDGTGFLAKGDPRLHFGAAGGWVGPKEQQNFENYMRSADHCVDPMLRPIAALKPRLVTRRRVDLVDDAHWYGSTHVAQDRRIAAVDDVIYSVMRRDRTGRIQIMGVHRPWGDRVRFSRREQALMNLLHRATAELLEPIADSPMAQRIAALSPRLRDTLEVLLSGASEKEAAGRLGLRLNTVHSYVKQIYMYLGVESRAELMALCLGPRSSR